MTTRIIAVPRCSVLPLWFVQIETAFGLPAHPLLLHVPVVFVPILGLAALAVAIRPRFLERVDVPLAAFSVVTLASTLLAAGAGEAFKDDVERQRGGSRSRPSSNTPRPATSCAGS